ncbi:ribonuclease J [Patescibacteria group bacterium]|nr:ribonuclease J [Patescibacteria group bacterium]
MEKIKIIPLGGAEEIGRNMTIVEYRNDIVIFDAGLQFPEEETPGIDYIIPNTKYLEERKNKIRGLIISHGHLDHIGAIPYLMDKIGNPTIYTTRLTKAMILKRQEEFPHAPMLKIQEIKSGDKIKLGENFKAKFFDITHTIPDAIGTAIETPLGNIIYPGDAKIEHNSKGEPTKIEEYIKLGKEKNLVLLLESTNSEKPGISISEATVCKNLEKIFRESPKRIIIGTFSSQIERIIEIIKIAEKLKRKVAIDGYSMKSNIEIAKKLDLFKPRKETIISVKNIGDYPEEKIIIVCTGAQGEKEASLMRIASHKHSHIKLHSGDTVILSSSIIPGNEKSIQNLKDNLARQGAKIIHYEVADVHASGHAYSEELKLIIKMLKPKFFIPVHGHYFMLKTNSMLAENVGIPKDNIAVPIRNGAIIEVSKDKIQTLKETAPANYVMVDGLGVGDVKEIVLRDRQMLSKDGIFVIIAVIDTKENKIKGSPDIISRGFVYLKESQELLKNARHIVKKIVHESANMRPLNINFLKDNIRERVGKYLFQKTKRRPMVLPVIIEV